MTKTASEPTPRDKADKAALVNFKNYQELVKEDKAFVAACREYRLNGAKGKFDDESTD